MLKRLLTTTVAALSLCLAAGTTPLWAQSSSGQDTAGHPETATEEQRAPERPKLAIFAFDVRGKARPAVTCAAGLADVLRDALAHTDRYRIYDRAATYQARRPQAGALQAAETGAANLGADLMIHGTVESMGGAAQLSVRVLEFRKGILKAQREPVAVNSGFISDSAVAGTVGRVVRGTFSQLGIDMTDALEQRLADYLVPTGSAKAWHRWCEAVDLARDGRSSSLPAAIEKLDQAIEADQFFVLGYLKLSQYWAELAEIRHFAGGAAAAAWVQAYSNARKVANLRPEAGAPQWRLALGYSAGPRKDKEKMLEAAALARKRLPGEPMSWYAGWVVAGRDPGSEHLQRAIALDPHPLRFRTALAAELSRRGKLGAAEKQIDQALNLSPHSPFLETIRGDTAMRRDQPKKARRHYLAATRADPQFVPALVRLAELHVRNKQPTEAFNYYQKVVKADPTHPGAHYWLAYHYQRTARMSEAIHHYQQALLGMPRNLGLYINLAQAYQASGFIDQAARHYQLALEIDPNFLQALLELSALYYAAGDLNTTIGFLTKAVEAHPDSSEAHFHLAVALATQRQYEQAIPHYRRVIELAPENAAAHHNLGLILLQQGDTVRGKPHLSRACKLGQREACQALESYEQYTTPRRAPAPGGTVQ